MTAEEEKIIDRLSAYYDSLPTNVTPPKTELYNMLMSELVNQFKEGAPSENTVRNWLLGKTRPADSKFIPVVEIVLYEHESKMKC